MKHMAREQITWHTEPNDSSVLPLPSSTHSIASLSYLLLYFFVVVLLRFSLAFLVLAHVRNCPESMWNVKKIFLQFSRRRRKWTTIMRISSESSVWSEFVTSQTRVQRERGKERGSERGTETSPKVDDQLSALQWVVTQLPLPSPQSQPVEGHASIE